LHIVEKNEALDYVLFMSKGLEHLEGEAYRIALGNRVWELLHGIANNYGCSSCRPGAKMLISGIHDTVNIFLGKPVYDPENFQKFVEHINEAHRKYEKKGIRHGIRHALEAIVH
jgi:hypothetical protein